MKTVRQSDLHSGRTKSCGVCVSYIKELNRNKNIPNGHFRDYTNEKFGRWTVQYFVKKNSYGASIWHCKCDCGTEKDLTVATLVSGYSKSCGCLRDKIITINEIGNKYGKLTVLSKAENTKSKTEGAFWLCQCECGNTIITSGTNLRLGHTQSCGCMVSRGEALIKQILTDNNINFKCQYQFSNCLTENHNPCKFDFAIFENNKLKCLIEYDGIQHFENSNFFGGLQQNQIRDKIKTNYCIKNNIPLVRIPYTDYENINIDYIKERIEEECIVATLLK